MSEGTKKFVFAIASFLAAILLWLYVVTVVAPEASTTVSGIPISIDGTIVLEERGLVITYQDVTTLSLSVNTSRVNLSKLNADSIRVNADASRIREPGEYALSCVITFPDTVRSSEVDLLRKSPDAVKITVSRLEKKTVPVTLNWTGSVKEGFLLEADNAQMEPSEVVITGPDYELEQIKEAVVYKDVSNLEETSVETLPITFLNADKEAFEFSELSSANISEVNLTLPVLRTKELTLKVDTLEGGGVTEKNVVIQMNPETIRVKGQPEVIERLDDTFVVGTVDLATLSNREEKSFNLSLPAGVTNISGEDKVTASFQITGVSTDAISVSDIRLENQPQGYHTEISTRTARVVIRGEKSEIREIKNNPDNGFYIVADLTDYDQTGAYTVPGRVVNDQHPDVSVVNTVEIGIVISNPDNSSPEE